VVSPNLGSVGTRIEDVLEREPFWVFDLSIVEERRAK
jgi:hypothetical protein